MQFDALQSNKVFLIAGLGNPGRQYLNTPHNLGFMAIDKLCEYLFAGSDKSNFEGLYWQVNTDHGKVILLKPMTFMNLSGRSVAAAMRFFKIPTENFLVILDDLALEPACIRMRAKGSAGGHNGLQNIIQALGTNDFARLRLGIGSAPPYMDSADYVLGKMDEAALADANYAVDLAVKAAENWLAHGTQKTMNLFNGSSKKTE